MKNSKFEILDGLKIIKSNLSYNDVCNFLFENKYKLFNIYILELKFLICIGMQIVFYAMLNIIK